MSRDELKRLLGQIRDEKSLITIETNHVRVKGAESEDCLNDLKLALAHLSSARVLIGCAAVESGYVPPEAKR